MRIFTGKRVPVKALEVRKKGAVEVFEWKAEFSVMHDGMDEQHKVLIGMLNDIEEMIKREKFGYINLVDIVERLESYVRIHFDYEEELMLRHSYPLIMEHTKEHNIFRDKLQNTYVLDIEQPKDFYYEMWDYLTKWLANHIMKVDRQLGDFLIECEAE
ncbi:hemerythrin-like metal-binding protein [Anaerotaenia torta]|uniref:bacteriohemerythrin n=1 Tax=Anaerotaenia torta TaxID=433293 RepID=UPI003D1AD983